jgi:hypothetical protein
VAASPICTVQSNVKKGSETSLSITIGERRNGGLSFGTLREEQEDGSLIVRFQAGGLQEMAFHAFT